jgi:hypothetical protein
MCSCIISINTRRLSKLALYFITSNTNSTSIVICQTKGGQYSHINTKNQQATTVAKLSLSSEEP